MFGINSSVVWGGAINNSETNGAPLARCGRRLKAPPTKPRENRAKRGVTRGISGWVSEPLVHLLASRAALPASHPRGALSPRNQTFLFYFSRGDELLNDKPYYIFCGELAKVRILWPFCTPAFYSSVRSRSYCSTVIRGADGTGIVRLVTTIRKTAWIWNPLSIFCAQWCYSLIEFRHSDT